MIVCRSIHRRRDALSVWKSRLGSKATYRALMEVFIRAKRADCAETVVDILKERPSEIGIENWVDCSWHYPLVLYQLLFE